MEQTKGTTMPPRRDCRLATEKITENHISREIDGDTLIGTWSVEDGMVTVETAWGSKTTQVGGSPPEALSYIMLRFLYEDLKTGFPSARPERRQ
jgi:hypothetical protein